MSVTIKLFLGSDAIESFSMKGITKPQAVKLIESLEVKIFDALGRYNFNVTDERGFSHKVDLDLTLPANVDDENSNEPVVFSGLLGTPFEYTLTIE